MGQREQYWLNLATSPAAFARYDSAIAWSVGPVRR